MGMLMGLEFLRFAVDAWRGVWMSVAPPKPSGVAVVRHPGSPLDWMATDGRPCSQQIASPRPITSPPQRLTQRQSATRIAVAFALLTPMLAPALATAANESATKPATKSATEAPNTTRSQDEAPVPTLVAIDQAGQAIVLRDAADRLSVVPVGSNTPDGHWQLTALTPDQARLQRLRPGASGAEQLQLTLTRNGASVTRIRTNPPYRPPAPSLHLQPARVSGMQPSAGSALALPSADHPTATGTAKAGVPAANTNPTPANKDGNAATAQPGEPL